MADRRREPGGRSRAERLGALHGLYGIVGDQEPVARASAAIDGGARVIQVRMKASSPAAVLESARRIVEAAAGRALVIVNDRADLAVLAGADGVHLGEEDLPVEEARRVVGPELLVGRTCRGVDEARAALAAGADHVGYGPIFPSRSKALAIPPRGLGALAETCREVPGPVVAIGGIGEESIAGVAAAGAACAAVIDDLFGRGDARERARLLASLFEEGARRRPGAR